MRVVPAIIGGTFAMVFVWALGFLPVILGAAMNSSLLIGLGVPFAFVWMFYAVARFFAVYQVIILEQPNVVRAFVRSTALSRGRKGHIFLTLLLVFVIFFVLAMAVSILAGIVGALTGNLAASTALQSLFTIVGYPLIAITQVILYYDTRIRAEGFDIELMTSALESSAPSSVS
jgi:hypothetical protein